MSPLTTADLDPSTLAALFADLEALTEIDEVLIKGATTSHAGVAGLAQARLALEHGARAIQIRYRWAGQAWLDTLMRTPDGVRLVRSPVVSTPEAP